MLSPIFESHASKIIPVDINDPSLAFYSPLWYPTSQAIGGVIESGTGTMANTPLTLVVGANTVTATGAGTFFVTMPEGGSVASDGATVTGSPVTITASTRTSVTLEGTGTFTCTVSNVFRSMDSNRHAVAVIGALWRPDGRLYDGADDNILVAADAALENLASFTILIWAKYRVADFGEVNPFLISRQTGSNHLLFYVGASAPHPITFFRVTDGTDMTAASDGEMVHDTWYFIKATMSTLLVPKIFVDEVEVSYSLQTTGTGNLSDDSGSTTYIGDSISSNRCADAIYGEIWIYNKEVSTGLSSQVRAATAWRYQ